MRRALLPLIPLVLATTVARAEDFSGFYAGINAGYARGRSQDARATPPCCVVGGRDRAGPDLPPSAADAAAAVRRPTRTAGAPASP